MDIRKCLGSNLKRLRLEKGLNQEALAEAAGLSAQLISNIETGKKWTTAESIAKLAQALSVEESALFRGPSDNEDELLNKLMDRLKDALSKK